MAGMARIDIIGHVGKDAETRTSQNGKEMASFSVAHSPRAQQGQPERTAWYRCTLVGARAESLAQYLVKGKQVFVRGDLDVREYKGNDGQMRTSLDVFVREIELLGVRQDSNQQAGQNTRRDNSDLFEEDADAPPF